MSSLTDWPSEGRALDEAVATALRAWRKRRTGPFLPAPLTFVVWAVKMLAGLAPYVRGLRT